MAKNITKFIVDGFKNIIKGLGTEKDARQYTDFVRGIRINQQLASNLYTFNWLCGKAIDAPVEDSIENWRTLLIADMKEKILIESEMERLELKGVIEKALKWQRIFGGAVIIPIIEGEIQSEPLELDKIKQNSLKNLVVLDRYNVYPNSIDRNILSPNFGKPEYYTVVRDGELIHHSRVVRFEGLKTTLYEWELNEYWGQSLFTRLWEPISDSQTVTQSISNLIYESNVDVYKIGGLNSMVAEGKDDLVVKRLKIAHEMKSIINGIALDGKDEYDKKSNTFANLAEIDDRFMYRVSGALGIPITRLIGREPAGLNATGESDDKIYQKSLQNIQSNQIKPALDVLDKIIIASLTGKVGEIEYTFNPTQQATETELAEISLKKAQRDAIYLGETVIDPLDAKAQLAEDGTYITITEESVAAEREALEGEDLFEETEV